MADGSSNFARMAARGSEVVVPLSIGQEYVLDLGVQPDLEVESFRDISGRLARAAHATLRVALARGDDTSDMPGTFAGAIEAAALLLQLSIGLNETAQTLEEPDNG